MSNKFNHSVLVVGAAKLTNATLKFLRMAILARLLSPTDFGVAATFWITTGILTAVTEIGVDKILIQHKSGNDAHFGAVAQTLLVIRGVVVSLLILVFSYQFAIFFDVPEAANEFALLAILPLLKGLEHRDYIRKQREMNFVPLATYQISPELITTILAFPVAVYFPDYRAFVYLSIAASAGSLIASHLLADAPIRFSWDKELAKRMIRFGWPLTISSALLVLTMQGDMLVISQYYSKHDLGLFAVAFTFATFVPNNLGAILTQIMLPYLSRIRDDPKNMLERIRSMNRLILWVSAPWIFIVLAYSRELIDTVYGSKFVGMSTVAQIITIVFFLRLLRQVPNTLCIVNGTTKPVMFSNLLRQVTLVIILILAVNKVELHWVASAGFVGELIAMVAVSHSVSGAMGCRISYWMNPIIGLIIFSIAGYLLVEGMVALGLQIVLLLLVLIMTGYSAIHAVRMLNTLNKG